MYPSYLSDRKELGFKCLKDMEVIRQLSDLENILKNPGTIILKQSNKTFVMIFSKEILVAVLIFFNCNSLPQPAHCSTFSSSETSQYCLSKVKTSRFLNSYSKIPDFILKLQGGSNDADFEEQEKIFKTLEPEQKKLVLSVLAKAPKGLYKKISINKLLGKVAQFIQPIIFSKDVWVILHESRKPVNSTMFIGDGNETVSSIDLLGPQFQKTPIKNRPSSIFVDGFTIIPNVRKSLMIQRKLELRMAENYFLNNSQPSGQDIEIKTKIRREPPLSSSEALGDFFQYSGKQLEKKGLKHLKDYGIPITGKTVEQIGIDYKKLIEQILAKPNLVVHKNGRLNKQEWAINLGDPETFAIISFENKTLYKKYHFITSYVLDEDAFEVFVQTRNIGMSPEEREVIRQAAKKKAEAKIKKANATSFYLSLPENARLNNRQLEQAEILQSKLDSWADYPVTEREIKLLERAKAHKEHKMNFEKNKNDMDRFYMMDDIDRMERDEF